MARTVGLVFAIAWGLRTILAVIGAAAGEIEAEWGSSATVTGTVSTVFVLTAGLAAPLAMALTRRWGTWKVTAASLTFIGAALLLVALGGVHAVWWSVILAGCGGGMVGALTPTLVAALLPGHVGVGVGVFMVGSSAGFYAASMAVPAAIDAGFSWNVVGIPLAVLAAVILVAWCLSPAARASDRQWEGPSFLARREQGTRMPLPRWAPVLVVFLSIQSISIFTLIAWVVPSLLHGGMALGPAASALALLSGLQVVSGLVFPLAAHRDGWTGVLTIVAAACVVVGSAAIGGAVVLGWSQEWVWAGVAALALGHGGSFAMANVTVAQRAPTAELAVRIGALMMFVSQLAGAAGPVLFGVLRDVSGGYTIPWGALCAVAVAQLVSALWLARSLSSGSDVVHPRHTSAAV